MKSLTEFIMEAGRGAAGSMSYKLDPVAQTIVNKADMDKLYQQIKDNIKNICKYDGELMDMEDTGYDWKHTWEYYESNGERMVFMGFHIAPKVEDREIVVDALNKFFDKQYSIKAGNNTGGLTDAVSIKPSKDFKFNLPSVATLLVACTEDSVPIFYIAININDIPDVWNKFNGNIMDFHFKKFGIPGGINDAAGRTLQEGDIVAFMRRAGTGGMEMGVVQSVAKKRVVINTEVRNTVTLDGSQVCLVQRGSNVVS